jgi:hypothetical protein
LLRQSSKVEGNHVKFRPDVELASRPDLARAYAINLARSVARLAFKNIRRTRDIVASEYNLGEWGRILSERAWLAEPTLDAFLIGRNDAPRLAKVDGRIVRIATSDYYRYRISALSELLARHAGKTSSLLELGAGFGYNLLSLSLDPYWSRLRGFDIAPNGIEAGRQIAGHFQLADRISFDRIDLTDANDPRFQEVKDSTVFTFFCIEQIPYSVEAVVENILRARPERVINIEPATDMLDLLQPRDLSSWLYLKSMDYQTRLFSYLDEIEKAGRIRILARERMQFASTIHNDGNMRVWEPV